MSYLLDTCIISKLRRINKYPDIKLENWFKKNTSNNFFISVLTIAEIHSGISKLSIKKTDDRQKKIVLENWLLEELIPQFQNRILPISLEVAITWGKLQGDCQQKGIIVPAIDGLIASTAIVNNLTVVTENINDFINTGSRLFNPWNI